MIMDNRVYEKKFSVTWQDLGMNGHLTMKAFANFMQEAAWQHAEVLGFGFDYMAEHQAVWVLVGVKAIFHRQPQWRDEVVLKTWHKGYKGVVSSRDYILYNARGEVIAEAASEWVLINHDTRRIVRPNILDPFVHTQLQQDALTWVPIPQSEATVVETCYEVVYSDMDYNGHTNNSRYFEWVSNVFEPLNETGKVVKRVEIKYQSECFMGDVITLSHSLSDDSFHIHGVRSSDGKSIFNVMLELTDSL